MLGSPYMYFHSYISGVFYNNSDGLIVYRADVMASYSIQVTMTAVFSRDELQ